jgi:uncharacterized damage-inducible protein DinB
VSTADVRSAEVFLDTARNYLRVEYRTKLRHAVEVLPESALWARPNETSNSVGNLLLHLAGNIRQWIVGGVGQQADARDRASEFAAVEGQSRGALLADLERALDEVDAVLARLTPAELLEHRTIQSREVTVLEAVFHVVEHFSYHLGQIVLVVKQHAPGALLFYEDAGGQARPLWKDLIK